MTRNVPAYPNIELSYTDYIRFRDLILARSGLYFSENKRIDLNIGISRALAQSSLYSSNARFDLNRYYDLLSNPNDRIGRQELEQLINFLTVGETYFFRDEAQFDALYNHVFPELIARKRETVAKIGPNAVPQLRIWSAGCASGEEPYSLAILLNELLPDIEQWHIYILGTDINQDSLDRAKEGVYSNWSFREERAKTLRPQYFVHEPERGYQPYRLSDKIKKMVTFARLNLIEDDFPSIYNNTKGVDLIVCRNVTIYFTQEVTQQIIQQFYESLVTEGWLVVGHSEVSLLTYRAFQPRSFHHTMLYQKTGQPAPWPEQWDNFTPSSKKPLKMPFTPPDIPEKPPYSLRPKAPPKPKPKPSSQPDPYKQAQMLLKQGDVEEAIERLQEKIAISPDFGPSYALLGRINADLGRFDTAKEWCVKAIECDQLLVRPYYTLALIYQHENKPEKAINNLKTATYLDHRAPLPYFNLAMLYRQIGDTKQARRMLTILIRLLEKLPPGDVVPDTDGKTAYSLLQTSHRILESLS